MPCIYCPVLKNPFVWAIYWQYNNNVWVLYLLPGWLHENKGDSGYLSMMTHKSVYYIYVLRLAWQKKGVGQWFRFWASSASHTWFGHDVWFCIMEHRYSIFSIEPWYHVSLTNLQILFSPTKRRLQILALRKKRFLSTLAWPTRRLI